MKDRIKEIRKTFSESIKTQEDFADFLGISKSNLASYETGRRTPSDAVIGLICQKCNVNEEWLRNGTLPMYKQVDKKLETYLGEISIGNDEFIQDLVEVYMELDQTSKDALKEIAKRMANKINERGQK